MLNSGDVVDLDRGASKGREAGLKRPVVVVTAQEILDESANVIQVVPLTSSFRGFGSEVEIRSDESNGLESDSAAQCQHIRSVSVDRVESVRGNVCVVALSEVRQVLALILDIS
ncbi:MAG: type II toxin-antitoxin system PemK/MazF family toxin [Acidimicrobiia bacterium]